MGELRLEESSREQGPLVREFLRRCFPKNPKADPRVMDWQYWDNPFGRTRAFVARDGDRVVGHIANYPMPMFVGSLSIPGALQVDAASDPEYRGQGIYRDLRAMANRASGEDGIAIALGNPNELSNAALAKFAEDELQILPDLELFVRPLQLRWLRDRAGLPRPVAWIAFRLLRRRFAAGGTEVDGIPVGLDELTKRTWGPRHAGVRAGSEWWRWRFLGHPDKPYRVFEVRDGGVLRAAAVIRLHPDEEVIEVLDLVAESRQASRAVISAAITSLPGSRAVTMLATRNGTQGRAARRAGLIRVPPRLRGRRTRFVMVVYPSLSADVSRSRWSLSGGALDWL